MSENLNEEKIIIDDITFFKIGEAAVELGVSDRVLRKYADEYATYLGNGYVKKESGHRYFNSEAIERMSLIFSLIQSNEYEHNDIIRTLNSLYGTKKNSVAPIQKFTSAMDKASATLLDIEDRLEELQNKNEKDNTAILENLSHIENQIQNFEDNTKDLIDQRFKSYADELKKIQDENINLAIENEKLKEKLAEKEKKRFFSFFK